MSSVKLCFLALATFASGCVEPGLISLPGSVAETSSGSETNTAAGVVMPANLPEAGLRGALIAGCGFSIQQGDSVSRILNEGFSGNSQAVAGNICEAIRSSYPRSGVQRQISLVLPSGAKIPGILLANRP